jgi:hypothetical protein
VIFRSFSPFSLSFLPVTTIVDKPVKPVVQNSQFLSFSFFEKTSVNLLIFFSFWGNWKTGTCQFGQLEPFVLNLVWHHP